MRLTLPVELGKDYKSPSQRARVITEGWGDQNLYCPHCPTPRLEKTASNTKVYDFVCPSCEMTYQLKGIKNFPGNKIIDSAYDAMKKAICEDRTPNWMILSYSAQSWRVIDLFVIPKFIFSLSSIEKRKPLSSAARRAGWVGCNIILANIPKDGRIPMVSSGVVIEPNLVRARFKALKPLEALTIEKRGWTLDVLNVIRLLNKHEFLLDDVYRSGSLLGQLHPLNLHVRDKIRQQLQVLRDLGFIEFVSRGRYRIL